MSSVENNIPKGDALSLPKGWVETTLGEVVTTNDNSIGRDFKYPELEYLDTGSITANKIDNYQIFKVSEAPSRAKRLVQDGDIIYSTVRPNQKHYGFIKNPKKNLVVSTGFTVIRAKELSYSKFIFYWLTQNSVTEYLHQLAEQSTSAYPSIKPIDIENLSITIPQNIEEQKAIAKILTAFDDKIELLQAQNKTLESIAQSIFKEWFGKYQIGDELPDGWRVGKIEDFIIETIGGDYGKETILDDYTERTICLRGTDLPDMKTGVPEKAPKRFLKKSKLNKCKLINGDIVIEISGGTENQSTGRVTYINEQILNNSELPMTCVNFCRILRPKETNNMYFIYSLFEYLYNRKIFFNWENGTTGIKNLGLKAFLKNFDLVLPSSNKVINKYNQIVKPLFVKIQSNNSQIQTLKQTRDTLLPKLMSGQLRVDEFKE